MGLINLLDKRTAELIAAGEVVERPASIVKELLENSFDAGAMSVCVEIKRGGIECIRITDDGCGIAADDVERAFMRHATSKIQNELDLEAINTLGFRGEALASIAAVSRVTLITRTAEEANGVRYTVSADGGHTEETGCPVGTSFEVRDLFYNTPARMKFLKKDVSEGNAALSVAQAAALSHPEVSVRFLRDGREEFFTPGDGRLLSAIVSVMPRGVSDGMIEATTVRGNISVGGYITKPEYCRASRALQYFCVNGRCVKNRLVMAALEEAYKNLSSSGKYPACVLNITLPACDVDVNVHPAKTEVKFARERDIFDAVYSAARLALENNRKAQAERFSAPSANVGIYTPPTREISLEPINIVFESDGAEKRADEVPVEQQSFYTPYYDEGRSLLNSSDKEQPAAKVTDTLRYVGEAFSTYIIFELGEDELVVIDKHAAHERMIFERLRRERASIESQELIAPVAVDMSAAEKEVLLENCELLLNAGFDVEEFGPAAVALRAVPAVMTPSRAADAVVEIAARLVEGKRDMETKDINWLYESIACRAAIKAGDYSDPAELKKLASDILTGDEQKYCPHGRPVYMIVSRKELETRFGR